MPDSITIVLVQELYRTKPLILQQMIPVLRGSQHWGCLPTSVPEVDWRGSAVDSYHPDPRAATWRRCSVPRVRGLARRDPHLQQLSASVWIGSAELQKEGEKRHAVSSHATVGISQEGAVFIKHLREKLKLLKNLGTKLQQNQKTLPILNSMVGCGSNSV